MANKFLSRSQIVYLCTLIVILLALCAKANQTETRTSGPYEFAKFSVRWPKAYCNSLKIRSRGITCHSPIKSNFSIHGIWPSYWPNNEVRPYKDDPSCTDVEPVPAEDITLDKLASILPEMKEYWPNVAYYDNMTTNLEFWRYQWTEHGMCFNKPNQPLFFYKAGLKKMKEYDFLGILGEDHIFPNNSKYPIFDIRDAVYRGVGKKRVQIQCNLDFTKTVQLSEIRLCFNTNGDIVSCITEFSSCPNFWENPSIKFTGLTA